MFILYKIYRNIFTSCLERERKKNLDAVLKLSVMLERSAHMGLEIEDLCCSIESGRGRRY